MLHRAQGRKAKSVPDCCSSVVQKIYFRLSSGEANVQPNWEKYAELEKTHWCGKSVRPWH